MEHGSACVISLLCVWLVAGRCRKTKEGRKGQVSDVNSLVSPGDWENNAGFSQSCSREAEMSFSAGLFSRNTNVFTLFWAPRSAFDCVLAARGAQLGFCNLTDVEPSVSPPPVGNNLIRMARSDTIHDGHHQDLFNHCCPECISGTTRRAVRWVLKVATPSSSSLSLAADLELCHVTRISHTQFVGAGSPNYGRGSTVNLVYVECAKLIQHWAVFSALEPHLVSSCSLYVRLLRV